MMDSKAKRLVEENRICLLETTSKRVYYSVVGYTGHYIVSCDRLRDEWKCDCQHFALKQTDCSHIKACRIFKNQIRITIKPDGSVWVGDRLTGHRVIMNGELCYVSPRHKLHFVRVHRGFAITKELVNLLRTEGYRKIIIDYKRVDGNRDIFEAYLEWFIGHAIEDRLGEFEPQLFLALDDWVKK
jgi:hypothetical protein